MTLVNVGPAKSSASAVPLLDLAAQFSTIEGEIAAAIQEVLVEQRFILGPKVEELEETVAAYCQSEFGVGVSSGTDALLLAMMALEIGPGDAVITTPYSFFATAGSIARVGATPVFCDIDRDTYNLSAASVETCIRQKCDWRRGTLVDKQTQRTIKALVPVHLYGQCANMESLLKLAGQYDLRVVEDAAQAIGAEDQSGRRAGSLGDVGCFSFFPSKNLGAYGDAGLCTTSDPDLAQRMRMLRSHGAKPKYYHKLIGGNFRIDALQAAVLLVKMKRLEDWTDGRNVNAAYYDAALERAGLLGHVVRPMRQPDHRHVFNQYVLRVERRDELRAFLTHRQIGTEIYYPVPLHLQECFSCLGYQAGAMPEAERAANETIALPIYPELTNAQQQRVVDAIGEFYGK